MITGMLSGLVNGVQQVVFDYEVTGSAVSSISTGDIFNGDVDGLYTIITLQVATASSSILHFCPNGDTNANNYGARGIYAGDTTVADSSYNGGTLAGLRLSYADANKVSFGVTTLYAKAGVVRISNGYFARGISGTTVSYLWVTGSMWSNTTDNIINGTFTSSGTNLINVGTRIIILKSNHFTGGIPTGIITTPKIAGTWTRVGSTILESAASSVTFSGLDGNTAVCYYLSMSFKSSTTAAPAVRPNNSSTANTYGHQTLFAQNTALTALRGGTRNSFLIGWNGTYSGYVTQADLLIFSKTGFIRPSIYRFVENISGTSVEGISLCGGVWNNTSDNITSIVCSMANFAAGSQLDLYALYT